MSEEYIALNACLHFTLVKVSTIFPNSDVYVVYAHTYTYSLYSWG